MRNFIRLSPFVFLLLQSVFVGLYLVSSSGDVAFPVLVTVNFLILIAFAGVFLVMDHVFFRATKLLTRNQSEVLYALFNGSPDGIIIINTSGIIESINPAACRLLEYTAGDILGRNVSLIMPEFYGRRHDRYIQDYLQSGIARIIGSGRQVEAVRKSGKSFPIRLTVSRFSVENDIRFAGVIQDMTEYQQLSAAVLNSVERERAQIAADLHDSLAQNLTACKLDMQRIPVFPVSTLEIIDESISWIRAFVSGLSPLRWQSLPLSEAITMWLQQLENKALAKGAASTGPAGHKVTFSAKITGLDQAVRPEWSIHIFRFVQEAVTNSLKHSGCSHVQINLTTGENLSRLCIRDNGHGIRISDRMHRNGLGIHLMQERAHLVNGMVQITSSEELGTEVCLEWTN